MHLDEKLVKSSCTFKPSNKQLSRFLQNDSNDDQITKTMFKLLTIVPISQIIHSELEQKSLL